MTDPAPIQQRIASALGVVPEIEAAAEAERRISFLADYLTGSGASGYVLGISGGVDSTVAGRLTQLACERAGKRFTAVRLPYGVQADEADAQEALRFIAADEVLTVDIKPSVDPLHAATSPTGGYLDAAKADFVKGNIKARIRMTAQYAVAGRLGALVVGTDHAAEAVMGFFTKHGDGAADITPLAGLTKGQVRQLGRHLGAPAALVSKVPTADLEEARPQLPDETAYGITYAEIDGYLVGEQVSDEASRVIETAYARTAHKRALPAAPVALG
ncbi:ammonia-dependent NAD(+) synthetase [Nocardioides sp. 616]|uniref:ammonia-dependent NAD(+) synthetase n=1 Tax=Nocardioides sp. 616 TaxID=2268090 RepID=UPI000CE4E832|nr:ammonia-dependent NAD(+) synthetase [Nocardioides sp. 616]